MVNAHVVLATAEALIKSNPSADSTCLVARYNLSTGAWGYLHDLVQPGVLQFLRACTMKAVLISFVASARRLKLTTFLLSLF
jgi:hypothetical protein